MSFLRSLIILVFLLPQLTFASEPSALKNVVDEYTYSMNVEWDQNDKVFAAQKEAELKANLTVLVEQGLTEKDVQAVFPLLDVSALNKELEGVTDVSDFIVNNHQRFYSQGASWAGEVAGYGIAAVFIGAMIFLIYRAAKKGCEGGRALDPNYKCDT